MTYSGYDIDSLHGDECELRPFMYEDLLDDDCEPDELSNYFEEPL